MAWSIPIKTTINGISGIISINGGTGISISNTSTTITITNSGVTSLQGNTGALSLSAGNGISISGLTINLSGSYSGNYDITGNLSVGGTLPLVAGSGIALSNNNKTIALSGVTGGTINNYDYNTNVDNGSYFSFTVTTGGTGKVNFWGIMTASSNNAGYWFCLYGSMFELANVGGWLSSNTTANYNTDGSGLGNFFFGTISGNANTDYNIIVSNASGGTIKVYGYFVTYMGF